MGRRYVGIDINPAYVAFAEARVRDADGAPPPFLVGRARYPARTSLRRSLARKPAATAGGPGASTSARPTAARSRKKHDQPSLV
jgi:hypothetical protein